MERYLPIVLPYQLIKLKTDLHMQATVAQNLNPAGSLFISELIILNFPYLILE